MPTRTKQDLHFGYEQELRLMLNKNKRPTAIAKR